MKFAVCSSCGSRIKDFDSKSKFYKCQYCGAKTEVVFTEEIEAFYGYYLDKKELKKSASGGAATVIAQSFFAQYGGVVIGVRWKEDFKGARYTVVEKPEDLVLLKGSKYVDVDRSIHWNGEIRSIYSIVGDYLNSGKKVLFIGLGCDVYAVKSFVKRKAICDDGLYTIDLLCGGTTPRNVMEQYVSWLEDKFKSTLKDFSVRYKKYGWTPMYLRACFKNGKVFTIPFFHSEYGYAFNHMKKESCYNCKYRGTNHLSDITLGDFWGCNHNSESYNSIGMSSIIVSGEKGYELLNIINKKIFRVAEADLEQVFKGDIYFGSSVVKDNKYQRYKQIYDKHGIFEAMKASTGVLKYHLLKSWIMSVKEIIDVRFRK